MKAWFSNSALARLKAEREAALARLKAEPTILEPVVKQDGERSSLWL